MRRETQFCHYRVACDRSLVFRQHLHNLWQCYYEDSASADDDVVALYEALSAKLDERACPSDKLIYSYYESISSQKMNNDVCGLYFSSLWAFIFTPRS